MAKLVFGCGYLGLRVAQCWANRGETVWAVTRQAQRGETLKAAGISTIVADINHPFTLPSQAHAVDTVLFAVGFDRTTNQSIEAVYKQCLQHAIAALPDAVNRLIYISSTGVYGENPSDWVDEQTPCHPVRAGGRASLAAENVLASSRFAARAIILRLAGIYGPGRLPKRDAIERGEPIAANATGFVNLIHVDDAAEIVIDVGRHVSPPMTLIVSDGHPVTRRDFYGEIARLLNAPAPQFVEPHDDSTMVSRGAGDKRVDIRKLQSLVTRPLTFPTYREGLQAILLDRHRVQEGTSDRSAR